MNYTNITFSSNSGVSVLIGNACIWFDVLHNSKDACFSPLSPKMWVQIKEGALSSPRYIAFSHCHKDHFSPILCSQAHKIWSQAKFILPENRFKYQESLSVQNPSFAVDGISLKIFPTTHEGKLFSNLSHYSYFLSYQNRNILFSGDAGLSDALFLDEVKKLNVDIAILPFPWVCTSIGRAAILNYINPEHLLVCHLPFPQDDVYDYTQATFQSLQLLPHSIDARTLLEPFQQEHF